LILGFGPSHRSPHGQIAGHRTHLALRRASTSAGAGSACTFDVKCLGTKARTVRGDPRQDISPDAFGSKGRLHHRAGSSYRYRRPGVEDITGDGAQSVEIRLCQDGHASPKRTGRVAFASRVTDSRLIQILRRRRRANSLSVFKQRASGVARVRRVTGFFPARRDGHPSGVVPHRNHRHHHLVAVSITETLLPTSFAPRSRVHAHVDA
jgi:hypothetical protein